MLHCIVMCPVCNDGLELNVTLYVDDGLRAPVHHGHDQGGSRGKILRWDNTYKICNFFIYVIQDCMIFS